MKKLGLFSLLVINGLQCAESDKSIQSSSSPELTIDEEKEADVFLIELQKQEAELFTHIQISQKIMLQTMLRLFQKTIEHTALQTQAKIAKQKEDAIIEDIHTLFETTESSSK